MIEKLAWLKGMTLSTLAQGKKFEVLDVDENKILIAPQSTEYERSIRKVRLEWAWNELVRKGELSQQEVFEEGSVNSAYIIALLAKMPGVTYKTKPVRLYYQKAKL